MRSCCRAASCEEKFNSRIARKNLKQYRKKGLGPFERQMVASIPANELDGARILEIGGGIGIIQAELITAGAKEGEIVELVSAYEPYARELADERGLGDRTHFRVADLLEQPESVSSATIVVLNRVVCCSPDGVRLAEHAARLAERTLMMSVPRRRVVVRVIMSAINAVQRLMRRSFRVYLHSRDALIAAAASRGLVLATTGQNVAWEFMTFRRSRAE